jgi:serine-type D-Ala-D-Ala carboxypeptidase/endopeptidase
MPTIDAALADLDERFSRGATAARIPGLAWGVVLDGRLVHTGGSGTTRDGEDRRPDADSVFRIASMTKSFTAATVLTLRDEGRLRLDDPVADHVPELGAWAPPTTDGVPVTIRQLLTMSSGLPTDDPWGDRQQDLALDRFADLLRAGPTFAWPPGTTFEYSNLGYGILGRVIANVVGQGYDQAVRDRLLGPMGMDASTYHQDDIPDDVLVHGYVQRDGTLIREGTDAYGALASMGGLFSSVRDLARWVAGFLDAWPARDGSEEGHPLRRASRREMQQIQRAIPPGVPARALDGDPNVAVTGYGYGLSVTHDLRLGTTVGHAGGYPGFGSHMAWHPATGWGVIGLGNRRYAPVRPLVADVLAALVRSDSVPRRSVRPTERVLELQQIVDGLLTDWDDAVADSVFAMNMDLDEPRELRRAAVEGVVRDIGLTPTSHTAQTPADDPQDGSTVPAPTSDSSADRTWWRSGARGSIRVSILVSPEPVPRIQRLDLEPVGAPSPTLVRAAQWILALDDTQHAPDDLGDDPPVDLDSIIEDGVTLGMIRAARVRFGAMRLGRPIGGDGRSSTTFEVESDRGQAELVVTADPATGAIVRVTVRERERDAPAEAW